MIRSTLARRHYEYQPRIDIEQVDVNWALRTERWMAHTINLLGWVFQSGHRWMDAIFI